MESEQGEKKSVTVDEIIERVGKVYDLTEEEMISGGKQRNPSEARGMIAYLVREVRGMSLTDLSRRLKRDVSSLSHAADRIIRGSKEDSGLEKKKQLLEKVIF